MNTYTSSWSLRDSPSPQTQSLVPEEEEAEEDSSKFLQHLPRLARGVQYNVEDMRESTLSGAGHETL